MAFPAIPSDLTLLFQSFTQVRPIAADVRNLEGIADETRVERFRYTALDMTTRVLICGPRAATIRRWRETLLLTAPRQRSAVRPAIPTTCSDSQPLLESLAQWTQ